MATQKSLKPVNLKCEHTHQPMGIDSKNPLFSWELNSQKNCSKQTAWRIIVSSSHQNAESCIGDMWDSDVVHSSEQYNITYAGKRLDIMKKYWWRVMVWDENSEPGEWSEPQYFVTGIFSIHDWKGRWFDPINGEVSFARHEFSLKPGKTIEDAFVYVAAKGDRCNSFELRLNGSKVGDDVFAPGISEDIMRALYMTYDVTSMLNENNVMGLIFKRKVSLVLCIRYTDGTVQTVINNETWKSIGKGSFAFSGYPDRFFSGRCEEYDARLEYDGWDQPGFDDRDWKPYNWNGWWTGPLYITPQLVGCKISETFKPVRIIDKGDGRYIVDFGRNISGFVRLKAEGTAGTEIKIKYAETLDKDGELFIVNYWRENYNKYIMKGSGVETYQPTFMYTGFRYVEITGYPGKLDEDSILSCFIHSDIINGSDFECSNEDVNTIYSCSKASFLSNLVTFPTDCPGRERRGWTADAFAVSEAQCTMFDMLRFYYKWFDDIKDTQRSNGWIPVELPQSTSPNADVLWPTASVLIPWDIYNAYGDKNFLKKYYKVMKDFLSYLYELSDENHYFDDDKNVSFGDWLSTDPSSKAFLASAYYYRCADLLSKMSHELGFDNDAGYYKKLAESIKESFNKRFLKNSNGKYYYENNSQSANSHALFFNLVPDELRENVLDSLTAKIAEDGRNTTGFLGTMCLVPALAENGRLDVAYNLITSDAYFGWLYMIKTFDLTTLGEDYDLSRSSINSYNHAFLGGSVCSWMYRHLAGIKPLKPGYAEIDIKPYIPNDMNFAKAKINTVRGMAVSSWVRDNDNFKLSVEIPPNTTAVVHVPADPESDISINDKAPAEVLGLSFIKNSNGYASFRIESGKYEFQSTLNR